MARQFRPVCAERYPSGIRVDCKIGRSALEAAAQRHAVDQPPGRAPAESRPTPLARASRVAPFDLVIFGGTGDLALRKLLPALFHRFRDGQMPADSRVIGVARGALSREAYCAQAQAAIERAVDPAYRTGDTLQGFLGLVDYRPIDLTGGSGWPELAQLLASPRREVRVFYLALSPQLYVAACERLRALGLVDGARVVIEKPIGRDLVSAAGINESVGNVFAERQIFRIDHYLGKETVQNLTALRFANTLFEPLWNSAHVDHVQITVAETVGVEWRAEYYDAAGALRDMVQNHLLQLLCLVALEPPASLQADALRDEKLKVLRALEPIGVSNVRQRTVRGQYRAGSAEGQPVKSYAEEIGRTQSQTDTFVAARVQVANW